MEHKTILKLVHALVLGLNKIGSLRVTEKELLACWDFESGLAMLNAHFEELKAWNGQAIVEFLSEDKPDRVFIIVPFDGFRCSLEMEVVELYNDLHLENMRITTSQDISVPVDEVVTHTVLELKRNVVTPMVTGVKLELNKHFENQHFWNNIEASVRVLGGEGYFNREGDQLMKFIQQALIYV